MGTQTLVTYAQYAELSEEESRHYELSEGELVEVASPKYGHNYVRDEVSDLLGNYLRGRKLGFRVCEQEFRLNKGTVRRPDIAFVRADRTSILDLEVSIIQGSPDLVVEVVSGSDEAEELQRKIDQYLSSGVTVVWVIYWHLRAAMEHRAGLIRRYAEGEPLQAEDLLPGFLLRLEDVLPTASG